MRKPILIVAVPGACAFVAAAWFSSSHSARDEPASQLCVVWSSGEGRRGEERLLDVHAQCEEERMD